MPEPRIVTPEKIRLWGRFKQMDEAARRKMIKFTWSGLAIMFIGLILIIVGLSLNTGADSAEGLLVGLGAIIILVGIIRLLIGFINPSSPSDLQSTVEQEQPIDSDNLDAQLFKTPDNADPADGSD